MTRDTPISTPMTDEDGPDFRIIELLFFAYRGFVSDPDTILEEYGFGRAHHRVLHFVNRQPGMTVARLLDILGITKQSLGRVLRQLIASGHIVQLPGPSDRRQRLLHPTEKGRILALQLSNAQSKRIRAALASLTVEQIGKIDDFLLKLVDDSALPMIEKLSRTGPVAGLQPQKEKK